MADNDLAVPYALDNDGNHHTPKSLARTEANRRTLYCPACKTELHYRRSKNRRAHFAHNSAKQSCPNSTTGGYGGGESKEHEQTKNALAMLWRQDGQLHFKKPCIECNTPIFYTWKADGDSSARTEHKLPGGSRADVRLYDGGEPAGVIEVYHSTPVAQGRIKKLDEDTTRWIEVQAKHEIIDRTMTFTIRQGSDVPRHCDHCREEFHDVLLQDRVSLHSNLTDLLNETVTTTCSFPDCENERDVTIEQSDIKGVSYDNDTARVQTTYGTFTFEAGKSPTRQVRDDQLCSGHQSLIKQDIPYDPENNPIDLYIECTKIGCSNKHITSRNFEEHYDNVAHAEKPYYEWNIPGLCTQDGEEEYWFFFVQDSDLSLPDGDNVMIVTDWADSAWTIQPPPDSFYCSNCRKHSVPIMDGAKKHRSVQWVAHCEDCNQPRQHRPKNPTDCRIKHVSREWNRTPGSLGDHLSPSNCFAIDNKNNQAALFELDGELVCRFCRSLRPGLPIRNQYIKETGLIRAPLERSGKVTCLNFESGQSETWNREKIGMAGNEHVRDYAEIATQGLQYVVIETIDRTGSVELFDPDTSRGFRYTDYDRDDRKLVLTTEADKTHFLSHFSDDKPTWQALLKTALHPYDAEQIPGSFRP